jgi:hypothetical protein
MHYLKQGILAIVLVTVTGLVLPAMFEEPVSAGKKSKLNLQPMTIQCAALGNTVVEVVAYDHDPNGHMPSMREVNGSRQFIPIEGSVTTTYTAVEGKELQDPAGDAPFAALIPLAASDPRLAGGYPPSFDIPPGHPYAYLGDGFKRKSKWKNKNFIDCTVIDVGKADAGTTCPKNGVLQDACFQNVYVAGAEDAAQENCLVAGIAQARCFVEGVAYHYTDYYSIRVKVKGQ